VFNILFSAWHLTANFRCIIRFLVFISAVFAVVSLADNCNAPALFVTGAIKIS